MRFGAGGAGGCKNGETHVFGGDRMGGTAIIDRQGGPGFPHTGSGGAGGCDLSQISSVHSDYRGADGDMRLGGDGAEGCVYLKIPIIDNYLMQTEVKLGEVDSKTNEIDVDNEENFRINVARTYSTIDGGVLVRIHDNCSFRIVQKLKLNSQDMNIQPIFAKEVLTQT